MGKINKEWHLANKMPKNPSDDQRVVWHIEHVRNCSCMPIPKGVLAIMKNKGLSLPD